MKILIFRIELNLLLALSSMESKLDQILVRLDSPTVSTESDGAQTYLVGPDRSKLDRKLNRNFKNSFPRFEELKEWFKEFCLKELKDYEY